MNLTDKEKTLSETTPLIFQWLPKNFGDSVPNNEDYPYLQRLVNWAEREPQRDIYLIINGAGLKQEQIESLREKLDPVHKVKVVDFSKMDLGDNDFALPTPIGEFKISELLKHRYDQQLQRSNIDPTEFEILSNNMPFGIILDSMRLAILQNAQKISHREDAIYMDFDILPNRNGQSIGEVAIPREVLMAKAVPGSGNQVENAIIAINSSSESTLQAMIAKLKDKLHNYTHQYKFFLEFTDILDVGLVFGCMETIIRDQVLSECLTCQ